MKSLRNASTLILVAPSLHTRTSGIAENRVLSLKRSSNASHFPNAHVFPGGNSDNADHITEWLSVLPAEILNVPLNIAGVVKPLNSTSVDQHCGLPESVSSRITAIRETFEECGILLCRRESEESNSKVTHLEIDDANLWRKKVTADARQFINLCRVHNCFPNISNLYFLSTWITPIHVPRRYSCKFFVAITDQSIMGEADGTEIESSEWHSVSYLLDNAYLPPPQIYELSMLKKFPDVNILCDFARKINSMECLPYIPIAVNTEDGLVMICPGDEKYDELNRKESRDIFNANCTTEKFRGHVMNRIELREGNGALVIRNCSPRNQDLIDTLLSKKCKV